MNTDTAQAPPVGWNAGGWFGSQLGSTLWLALLGGVFVAQGRASGWALLLAFAAANGIGVALWGARGRLAAYTALQTLVGVTGLERPSELRRPHQLLLRHRVDLRHALRLGRVLRRGDLGPGRAPVVAAIRPHVYDMWRTPRSPRARRITRSRGVALAL